MSSLKTLTNKLTKLIFEELPGVFENYKEIAVKIAKDLGKDEPDFDFSIPNVESHLKIVQFLITV